MAKEFSLTTIVHGRLVSHTGGVFKPKDGAGRETGDEIEYANIVVEYMGGKCKIKFPLERYTKIQAALKKGQIVEATGSFRQSDKGNELSALDSLKIDHREVLNESPQDASANVPGDALGEAPTASTRIFGSRKAA